MRTKNAVASRTKHKKVLKSARGMDHSRRRSFRMAKQGRIKALVYAYRDRRNKKRDLRNLWISRINIAARNHGTTYSKLITGLKTKNIDLNRKILAELAINEPMAFKKIVSIAKQ